MSQRRRGDALYFLFRRMCLQRSMKQRGCAQLRRLDGVGLVKAKNFQQRAEESKTLRLGRVLEEIKCSNHAFDRASRGSLLRKAARVQSVDECIASRDLQLLTLRERIHVAHESHKVAALLQVRHSVQGSALRRHTRICGS